MKTLFGMLVLVSSVAAYADIPFVHPSGNIHEKVKSCATQNGKEWSGDGPALVHCTVNEGCTMKQVNGNDCSGVAMVSPNANRKAASVHNHNADTTNTNSGQ